MTTPSQAAFEQHFKDFYDLPDTEFPKFNGSYTQSHQHREYAHWQASRKQALEEAQKVSAWIPVGERLPDEGTEVIVYTPPLNGEDEQYDFEKYEDECFVAHHNNYEHFCIVAKGGSDCAWIGPSEKPKYTHWMPLPKPPIAIKELLK